MNNCKNNKTYGVWNSMKQRCLNPNNTKYHYYGGRGIIFCDQWKEFPNFLKDMGEKPTGKTLDRIDGNGNYCKENCRWSTRTEQNRNTSRNKYLTYNGETLLCVDWSKKLGFRKQKISNRIKLGWPVGEILGLVKHLPLNKVIKVISQDDLKKGLNRKEQIKYLRSKGFTLKEIGIFFKITGERVRQILLDK